MSTRESDFHYSPWLMTEKEMNWMNLIILSLLFHVLFFYLLTFLKHKPEISQSNTNSSIHVRMNDPQTLKSVPHIPLVPKNRKEKKLLTNNEKGKSSFYVPDGKKSTLSSHQEDQTPVQPQSLMPSSNSSFFQNLREQSRVPDKPIVGEEGDVPIEGPSLAPTNEPRVVSRFSEKDMTMFQFTKEFQERFGAVWNSEERVISPSSPLRPGDVVYYKIYINTNGHMEKYENLSRLKNPQKNYDEVDSMFASVISHVFPMSVPPKFANKNLTLTEVIAIQVVDRNRPVQFSF